MSPKNLDIHHLFITISIIRIYVPLLLTGLQKPYCLCITLLGLLCQLRTRRSNSVFTPITGYAHSFSTTASANLASRSNRRCAHAQAMSLSCKLTIRCSAFSRPRVNPATDASITDMNVLSQRASRHSNDESSVDISVMNVEGRNRKYVQTIWAEILVSKIRSVFRRTESGLQSALDAPKEIFPVPSLNEQPEDF